MIIEEPRDLEELAVWFSAVDPHELVYDWRSNGIAGGSILVAYENRSIAGYVQFAAKTEGSVYVYHVRVDPKRVRRGIASRLYESIIPFSQGSELRATVPFDNRISVSFHNTFRRRISPESEVFTGGEWVCPYP